MPYCSSCGNQASPADAFCAYCGARQPVDAARARPAADPFSAMSPRTAAVLCYIPAVGWIASIIVLAAAKFRTNLVVRFHAFQGLYLFVAWLIVDWVLKPVFRALPHPMYNFSGLLHLLILFLWIFMMVKASHDEAYALPIIGELAERSAAEH